jgi:hypothetical protein
MPIGNASRHLHKLGPSIRYSFVNPTHVRLTLVFQP